MKLKDKVAIVTGAGQGIGQSIASSLSKEGAKVVLADINGTAAEQSADEIRQNGGTALALSVDVSVKDQVSQMVERTVAELESVDILVNNAGVRFQNSLENYSEEEFDKTISVCLKGTFLCTQATVKHMLENKRPGKIINIASIAGTSGLSNRIAYCAAKGGIISFTKAAAWELAQKDIYVNAIAPGIIETPLTAKYFENESFASILKSNTPLNRWGTVQEVSSSVVFLASDDSSFVNGTVLYVDGGWTAGKGY